MKNIFCLIAAVMLMSGCDDGDMGYKTFDFTGVPVQDCTTYNQNTENSNEIYYKINGTEGLTLKLAKSTLINSPTPEGQPRKITLGGSNTLIYQDYVSKPTSLCLLSEIPASKETWIGQGTLSVITTEYIKNEKLIGYKHTVTIENVSFNHNGETITIVDSPFGEINKEFGFTFNFVPEGGDAPNVKKCTTGSLLYTRLSTQLLSLDVVDFDFYFEDETGTKTIVIPNQDGDDAARVLFNVYSSSATDDNACGQGSEVPSLPIQKWQLSKGSIIIITTETGGIFSHAIYLKDAEFRSLINSGDTFTLDQVITIDNPNGYYFGFYQ